MSKELKVTLVGSTLAPEAVLYSAFRMCYSTVQAKDLWEKVYSQEITQQEIYAFLKKVLATGHTAPLRQLNFIFVVDNISRAATAQFNRHHIGIERAEMSQRYVDFKKSEGQFITPPTIQKTPEVLEAYAYLLGEVKQFYKFATDKGIPKEDARFGLPMSTVSREQFSMGFQAMQSFLDVRMCSRAQWEIRGMAWQIYKIMRKKYPFLSKYLGPKCWYNRVGYCDELQRDYRACKWSKHRPHKVELKRLRKNLN